MASGSFYKSISAYDYRLIVEWSSTATNSSNSSVIKATIKLYAPYTLYISARTNNTVVINGATYTYNAPAISTTGGTFTLGTITTNAITHNANGSKDVTISANFALNATINGTYYTTVTATDTVSLDTIPRAATITAAPNFNDEENPTITYVNGAGNAVTTLQACISLTGSSDDIAYRDISKTGTSYTFNLTDAERNVLRNATKTANSRTIKFYIKTILNGSTYYSSVTKTLTIVNAAPTLNPVVTDNGSVSKSLTGDAANRMIRGYNSMSYQFNAAALKGATITNYSLICGDKSSKQSQGTLGYVYSNEFKFTVTDSRGNSATETITKTMIEYVDPTCVLETLGPNADGIMNFTVSGSYWSGNFGAVSNTLTVQYRLKEGDGSYGAWTTVTASISGNTYTVNKEVTGLNYRNTYTAQARVLDKIYNDDTEDAIYSEEVVTRTTPVYDWGRTDFNLNVPLRMNHTATVLRFTDSGNTVVSGDNAVYLRPNGTDDETGQVRIDTSGNTTVSGGLTVGGRKYAENKVLWSRSNGWTMKGDQIATLSEAVSAQPHGIVLVFSYFDGTTGQDYGFNSFFVSKQEVAEYPDKAHVFIMSTTGFTKVATKNLIIGDTAITGHSDNVTTGTAESGIKFTNTAFVLRRVVGV